MSKTKRKAKFEVLRNDDGLWYFHLKAPNGEIVHQSECYARKAGALKGIASIRKHAAEAEIAVVEPEPKHADSCA